MATQQPPIFISGQSHPSEDVRRAFQSIIPTQGVIVSTSSGAASTITDLKVSQRGAGANMSVDVATGRVAIIGTESTYQGTYLCDNRGTTNLVIGAAHASSARIDRVVAVVQDAAYSGSTSAWALSVVAGTASSSPAAPAAPNNSVTLATVTVPAAATSIVNANITDGRTYAAALGGTQRTSAAPSAVVTSPVSGQRAYNETDYKNYEYTTATSGWQLPWGMPWGIIAAGSATAATTDTGAGTDIPSLTGSLPATWPANRRVRIRCHVPQFANSATHTSAQVGVLYIKEGATVVGSGHQICVVVNGQYHVVAEAYLTPSSGAHTYKATLLNYGANGTLTATGSATEPMIFTVEDCGPNTTPA